MLSSREARWLEKRRIAADTGLACVCLTLRMPFELRTSARALEFFNAARDDFEMYCKNMLTRVKCENGADGPYQIWTTENAENAKRAAVEYEETNQKGELCDIDVTASDLTDYTRSEMSLKPRLCAVCGRFPARECISGRRHTKEETIKSCEALLMKFE